MSTKNLTLSERELLNNVMNFIKSLTIKNPSKVRTYETAESAKDARNFILTYENNTDFFFYDYSEKDLKEVGIIHPSVLEICLADKKNIPENKRTLLFKNKRNDIIESYIEKNDYFRTLNGLPSLEETNFIPTSLNKFIHELTDEEYYKLDALGEIESIKRKNPKVEYLNYLGNNKIGIYEARTTRDFYIMDYNHYLLEEEQSKKFIDLYYEVLVYTMSVVYSDSYKMYDQYDNFIILFMILATTQKFFSEQINFIIKRELYDLDSIRNMFLSYGLPFYEDIPLKYQRKILKNINNLLSYKGTDQVIIDISDIFGFKDTELYKYYLVKDFKRRTDGTPILEPENKPNDNFELKFAQVPLGSKDISSFLRTDYLYQSYYEVILGDPYWGNIDGGFEIDEQLEDEIKAMDFNYVATKYLSINTMFNMSQAAFESCYFFNMINKMKEENLLGKMNFYSSNIKQNESMNVFSVVTAIWALLYRRFGYSDKIIYTPTAIATTFGFNFEGDLEECKRIMLKNSTIHMNGYEDDHCTIERQYDISKIDKELLRVFDLPINTNEKEETMGIFFKYKEYGEKLNKAINNCDDYKEYKALSKLYEYNMYSDAITTLYNNGEEDITYSTYTDYLKDNDYGLYEYVNNNSDDKEKIIKALDNLIMALDTYFNSVKFNYIFDSLTNVTSDLMKKYLMQMINLFKAYSVEIKKVNVYYIFDDKVINTIRLFSLLKFTSKLEKADSIEASLLDDLKKKINLTFTNKDLEKLDEFMMKMKFKEIDEHDMFKFVENFFIKNYYKFAECINLLDDSYYQIDIELLKKDIMNISELLGRKNNIVSKKDNFNIKDKDKKITFDNNADKLIKEDYIIKQKAYRTFNEKNNLFSNDNSNESLEFIRL